MVFVGDVRLEWEGVRVCVWASMSRGVRRVEVPEGAAGGEAGCFN